MPLATSRNMSLTKASWQEASNKTGAEYDLDCQTTRGIASNKKQGDLIFLFQRVVVVGTATDDQDPPNNCQDRLVETKSGTHRSGLQQDACGFQNRACELESSACKL